MGSLTCPDCTRAATTWNWHGYRNECPDCQIRAMAQAPKHIRELRYDQIRKQGGEQAEAAIRQRVREEFARIQSLKQK